MHSGTLEHMCINPDGPLCYCGNRGCLETYCSVDSLEQAAGMTIKEFFPLYAEKKSSQLIQVWEDLSPIIWLCCYEKFKFNLLMHPGHYQRLSGTLFY